MATLVVHPTSSSASARLRRSLLVLALAASVPAVAGPAIERLASTSTASTDVAREAYANLPLSFIPNRGQAAEEVLYSAQAGGFTAQFTQREARLAFAGEEQGQILALRFLGASPNPAVIGRSQAPGKVNYLIGDDPAGWHTAIPTFGEVVYRELWPGIDMVFRGKAGALKYEFLVRPGSNLDAVRLAYAGAEGISVGSAGDLRIATSLGPLTDARPTAYQMIGGDRLDVGARYALTGSSQYGFAVNDYDARYPLVVDPGLVYSTFLGGGDHDAAFDIAVDAAGNAFVTGDTRSFDLPTTPGAFDTTINSDFSSLTTDAFVTKLNPAGSALVYSTYLGGERFDFGTGIALDSAGNAYVAGTTDSSGFPTTPGAFDTDVFRPSRDAFVTKLNPAGSALVYSTLLGGIGFEQSAGIAVDSAGNAYLTGKTHAVDFPTTTQAYDPIHNSPSGGADGFVTKLNPAGSALVYSTFLGGAGDDFGTGISLDTVGDAFVTGHTGSLDFPTTPGAFDTSSTGVRPPSALDAFVTKLNPEGSALAYSTYLGGAGNEEEPEIALDSVGNAFVIGWTSSSDFPTTPGAFDTSSNGTDAFVTKLDPTGSALAYSTYLGGSERDAGGAIAVDSAGNAHVTGETQSPDFPTTPGPFDRTFNSPRFGNDAFVTRLDSAGRALGYSTYLGGFSEDFGLGIAVDAGGDTYVTGATFSEDFPVTRGAFDPTSNSSRSGTITFDPFITKLSKR